MSGTFKDHFSRHAASYRDHRPGYPPELFAWLANLPARHDHAWDCATGNGQAAVALAPYFNGITATDASPQQIEHGMPHSKVRYRTASAEHSGLPDSSVDLISVAQAAHWFDLPAFAAEVQRVLRPGGVLALWTYGLTRISPDIDQLIDAFYDDVVGPYWPPERHHVENGYRDFVLPFTPIDVPAFDMRAAWTLEQTIGYLRSWSATQHCIAKTGKDVTQPLKVALNELWPDGLVRQIRWPLSLRCVQR